MEDFGSFWTFQENVEDLKQKLQYVTYELEMTRKETSEEIMKKNNDIKKLLMLLQSACKERDEAKSQVKKFQQQILAINNKPLIVDQQLMIPTTPFSPDSPLLSNFPVTANSGLTESNSNGFSQQQQQQQQQAQSHHHVSSPVVDSLSYSTTLPPPPPVSSPDSSNNNNNNNNNNNICFNNNAIAMTKGAIDGTTLTIERMAKGRPRPEQGKLLQAVLEAGPLLQTLMVAGSLPQWRNPPGLMTRQIPPVHLMNSKQLVNSAFYGQQMSCSMLDFGSSASHHVGRIMPSALSFDSHNPKRQRLH